MFGSRERLYNAWVRDHYRFLFRSAWALTGNRAVAEEVGQDCFELAWRHMDQLRYAKAQTNCVACHSAEYMLYQPPNAPRPYWDAMVKRMKMVFKAPLDDADIPVIVDYLAKTYGNEQPK